MYEYIRRSNALSLQVLVAVRNARIYEGDNMNRKINQSMSSSPLVTLLLFVVALIACSFPTGIYCIDDNLTSTTPLQHQDEQGYDVVINDFILVDTLVYNKSGTINSISWSNITTAATTTESTTSSFANDTDTGTLFAEDQQQQYTYYLVAASGATFQVWKSTTTTTSATTPINTTTVKASSTLETNITTWNLTQLISQQPIVRAVSFSPDGQYLALGNDEGVVEIYSMNPTKFPWKPVSRTHQQQQQTLSTTRRNVNGKVRSLAWHTSSRYLAAAGITFNFVVWDIYSEQNWTYHKSDDVSSNTQEYEYHKPPDTYVHYMDWNNYNEFVVDRTIYKLFHLQDDYSALHQSSNIFSSHNYLSNTTTISSNETATTMMVVRPIAVLDACRLCTLSQWSPDGRYIATAFGSEICISEVQYTTNVDSDGTNKTGTMNDLVVKSIYNVTTVVDSYMIISTMSWSPNSQYLAVGGIGNYNLFVYTIKNGTSEPPLIIPTSTKQYGIDAIAWRPDGMQIAIGTYRFIEIRDVQYQRYESVTPTSTSSPRTTAPPSPTNIGDSGIVGNNDSQSTHNPEKEIQASHIGTPSMIGIGVAAVITSLVFATFIFHRRMKYVIAKKQRKHQLRDQKDKVRNTTQDDDDDEYVRENRSDHQNSEVFHMVEVTASDEDLDFSDNNILDRIITVPRTDTTKL